MWVNEEQIAALHDAANAFQLSPERSNAWSPIIRILRLEPFGMGPHGGKHRQIPGTLQTKQRVGQVGRFLTFFVCSQGGGWGWVVVCLWSRGGVILVLRIRSCCEQT